MNLGPHEIDTWYFSPYPAAPGVPLSADMLYICEFDLKYFRKESSLHKHLSEGLPTHPPGARIPPPPERLCTFQEHPAVPRGCSAMTTPGYSSAQGLKP